jgi:uncharacterized protein YaaN involved in tellurite resistance
VLNQDYQISDKDFINRLDKRLADMKIVRFIMLQSLAQIRRGSKITTHQLPEKAQSICFDAVWKTNLR